VVAGYLMLGGALGVVVGGFAGLLAWKALARLEGRGERQRSVALMRLAPLLADLVAAALAAGRDPGSALRLAAESAGPEAERELAVFSASLALGADPVAVWRDLSRHPQFGAVGRAFVRASETGSSVTEAMKRGAEDLRALDRSEREAAARTVATRAAAPLGVCLLPAFVLVGIVPLVAGAVQQLVL
jgi:Flp pilus assembly protein TadB